jgi:adenylyltransferase/sulfurtransferase
MALSEPQIRRYARHVLLPDVGGTGQARLLAGAARLERVTGAGEAALLYLAAAGVGTIVVADGGVVDAPGFLFEAADVGRPRLDAARDRVAALNPDVRVVADGVGVAVAAEGDELEDGARAARLALEELLA